MEYATHLSQICYACTREQILDIVEKIVERNGGPNPLSMEDQAKSDGHYSRKEIRLSSRSRKTEIGLSQVLHSQNTIDMVQWVQDIF